MVEDLTGGPIQAVASHWSSQPLHSFVPFDPSEAQIYCRCTKVPAHQSLALQGPCGASAAHQRGGNRCCPLIQSAVLPKMEGVADHKMVWNRTMVDEVYPSRDDCPD